MMSCHGESSLSLSGNSTRERNRPLHSSVGLSKPQVAPADHGGDAYNHKGSEKELMIIASLSVDTFDLFPADEFGSPHYHHEVTPEHRHQPQRRKLVYFPLRRREQVSADTQGALDGNKCRGQCGCLLGNLTLCPRTHKYK